ncbi:hypothetical protein FOA52_016158 [Chlamydomonas sp. UWO 241]|nr:hypothetical protein FOA52_016158 [Chlamydomonas sp. UWO 241]
MMARSQAVGEAGDVDAAIAMAAQAESLTKQHADLLRRVSAPERTMAVCDVCGIFMNSTDNKERRQEHYAGKQYIGWKAIREEHDRLVAKFAGGGGGGGGVGVAPFGERAFGERVRERLRERSRSPAAAPAAAAAAGGDSGGGGRRSGGVNERRGGGGGDGSRDERERYRSSDRDRNPRDRYDQRGDRRYDSRDDRGGGGGYGDGGRDRDRRRY